MKGYKFIAGAVCPSCGDLDSVMLKNDDSMIKCVSCNYFQKKEDEFDKKGNERQVNIRFLSTVNGSAPVTFYPTETNIEVMTDKVSKTSYVATNNTNKRLTLSIVPSVSPGLAAENII